MPSARRKRPEDSQLPALCESSALALTGPAGNRRRAPSIITADGENQQHVLHSNVEIAVLPDPECRDNRMRVAWSLTDWTPGTKAHWQCRRGTGEDWQEATVVDHGQQSYEATFGLTGGPGLLWRVGANRGVTGPMGYSSPGMVYYLPEAVQSCAGNPAVPAIQNQIVVDVPNGSRATAPQAIPLGPDMTASTSVFRSAPLWHGPSPGRSRWASIHWQRPGRAMWT